MPSSKRKLPLVSIDPTQLAAIQSQSGRSKKLQTRRPSSNSLKPFSSHHSSNQSHNSLKPSSSRSSDHNHASVGFSDDPVSFDCSCKPSHLSSENIQLISSSKLQHHQSNMLWCDQFFPSGPIDLAIHPKKLQLIQAWLNDALRGANHIRKYRRVLILTGPAGSGKSTIIRTFAQRPCELTIAPSNSQRSSNPRSNNQPKSTSKPLSPLERIGYEILEWRNSGHESSSSKPQEFSLWLLRAGVGSTLSFDDHHQEPSPISVSGSTSNAVRVPDPDRSTLLLVDDLPNLYHAETLSNFCHAVRQHLHSPRPSTPPLVVIISDTTVKPGDNGLEDALVGTSQPRFGSNSEDRGLNAYSLLPIDILHHPACCLVKLNGVNDTLMKKMLHRIVDRTHIFKGIRLKPSLKDLDLIIQASGGDIRAALNNLQLLHNGSLTVDHSHRATKKTNPSGKSKSCAPPSHSSHASLLAARDESLVIFHSLGKILFNKRWGDDPVDDAKDKRVRGPKLDKLPPYWKMYERRQTKTDIDRLYSGLRVPVDPFIVYLHQNYSSFTNEVEENSFLLEYLSQTDAMFWNDSHRSSQVSISGFYQFHITTRAIRLGLPSPVTRKYQKFFKPFLWNHSRQLNENSNLCDSFRHQVDPLREENLLLERDNDKNPCGSKSFSMGSIKEFPSVIHSSRKLLAIEVFPFLNLIAKYRANDDEKSYESNELIERLTKFKYPEDSKKMGGRKEEELLSEDEVDGNQTNIDPEEVMNDDSRLNSIMNSSSSEDYLGTSGHRLLPQLDISDHQHTKLWFEDEDDIVDSDP